jgi:hypothetical protein
MNIIVFLYNGQWVADVCNFSGTPPIGRGKTKEEAIGRLILHIASEKDFAMRLGTALTVREIDNPRNLALRGDIFERQLERADALSYRGVEP